MIISKKILRHLLETLVLSFNGKKGNTNSIGQLRTFCSLKHLQSNVFYPSSTSIPYRGIC